jgi:alpha-L-rhamnosidase
MQMTRAVSESQSGSFFQTAQAVWPKGRRLEMNLNVGFRAGFEAPAGEPVRLCIAACSLYRVFLNGAFLGHGPARGPKGHHRVDVWDLTDRLGPGQNLLALEVASYNANGYSCCDDPPFLQAEVVAGGASLASTFGEGEAFQAMILSHRVQKAQRYSFQRPFSEIYRLSPGVDRWRSGSKSEPDTVACEVVDAGRLLPRRVPYPRLLPRPCVWDVASQRLRRVETVDDPWRDRSLTGIGPTLRGYGEEDLEIIPSLDLQHYQPTERTEINQPADASHSITLDACEARILDFGVNLTGFAGCTVTCEVPSRLMLTFDEILTDGDVDFTRMSCVNIIDYHLQPGTYELETFEPYTMRYIKPIVLSGRCAISGVFLRDCQHPGAQRAEFCAPDGELMEIFQAARRTFAQNSVDVFMDCPSRERAGWLCDSYFTARVAADLCGETSVEKNFLENYLLPSSFEPIPEGMLPMCYPSDHEDGKFIPQWAMWFVLQLEEYLYRSGDRELVEALRPRVEKLLEFLEAFRNEDGLLESLPSWNFVEWSMANEFVQDVGYPGNMLYAGMLDAAGRLYHRDELQTDAARLRKTIAAQSFDGEFFVDNAVREDGRLVITRNRTETCQYFAFYFGVATPATHAELWRKLSTDFGPDRREAGTFPEIHHANAFIGNYLRLELLSRFGEAARLVEEVKGYFLNMARRTGTLWENDTPTASCNHGFASHVAHSLLRDALWIGEVDVPNRHLRISPRDVPLPWCSGTIPVGDGAIEVAWWRVGEPYHLRVRPPAGWLVEVEPTEGFVVVREP